MYYNLDIFYQMVLILLSILIKGSLSVGYSNPVGGPWGRSATKVPVVIKRVQVQQGSCPGSIPLPLQILR